jgi:hypothetical protein
VSAGGDGFGRDGASDARIASAPGP